VKVDQIKSVAFLLADGAAVAFPAIGPFVAIAEKLIEEADRLGIVPHELSAEQVAAIASGMAAARASAITSDREKRK
jgi:hypothetical protein